MAVVIKDRVQESATANTTVSFTLTGAVSGYRTFASTMAVGDICRYCAVDATGSTWEVGVGTYSATNTLTRSIIEDSSSGSAITFANNPDVFLDFSAKQMAALGGPTPTTKGIVQSRFIRVAQGNACFSPCQLQFPPTLGNTLVGILAGAAQGTPALTSYWTTQASGTLQTFEMFLVATRTVDALTTGQFYPTGWSGNAGNLACIEVAGYSTFTGFSGTCTVSTNTITAAIPASSASSLILVCYQLDNNPGISSVGTGLTTLSDFGFTDVSTNHEAHVYSLAGSTSTQSVSITMAGAPSSAIYCGVVMT